MPMRMSQYAAKAAPIVRRYSSAGVPPDDIFEPETI